MAEPTNSKLCRLSNLAKNIFQLMISFKKSTTAPSVISLSDPEVVAVDGDELKKEDQFHGEVLEKPWKVISCGNKSSHNGGVEQKVSICQTSDIMANPEDDENNPDYTRSNDKIIKSSSTDSRRDIPEHLLFDILVSLPVITLLRFKSICKSWYALIGSSIFVTQHFEHNRIKDNLLCFLNPFAKISMNPFAKDLEFVGYKFFSLSGNKFEVYSNFDCGQFGNVVESYVSLALSSNGIICLEHSKCQEVALWNPATKQLRHLPKSSVSYQSYDDWVFFGFGYNVKSDDYKVVRTIGFEGNLHNSVVEVYSLRDNCWRSVLKDAALPFGFLKASISKNGTCFWISCDWIQHTYSNGVVGTCSVDAAVVSFDLNDETYGTMPLPKGNVPDIAIFSSTLDFLRDKLAYIYGLEDFDHGGPYHYEIWVLHEYGVKESWSKVWKSGPSVIPTTCDDGSFIGLSKNADYLFVTNWKDLEKGILYWYYLGSEENEYPELHQLNNNVSLFVRYTESLFQLGANDA